MRVIVQANLVVGFWQLIPMEPGSDNSVDRDTATVTKDNDETSEK